MWPGWLAGARVVGVWVQQLTEACGPGMPGPYGELKEIGAAAAGIPPALRRHLPLTREAGGAEGSRPLPTNGRFNGSRRKVCGPGMPGPYWVVKGKQSATGENPSGAAAPPPFDKGGRGTCCPDNRNPPSDSVY